MDIEQKVTDSFGDAPREDVVLYIDWLRSALDSTSQALRRAATLVILLAAVFELVIQSPKTALTLGGFTIAAGSVVIVFIPALTAYVSFQVIRDTIRFKSLQMAFLESFKLWRRVGYYNDLDLLVLPGQAAFWDFTQVSRNYSDWRGSVIEWGEEIAAGVIATAVIAFEAQAYYILYTHRGTNIILWIISAAITLFFLLLGSIQFSTLGDG